MTAAACIFAASFPALYAASAMIRATDCFGWAIRTNIFGRLTGVEQVPENAAKLIPYIRFMTSRNSSRH
jgi:hypothetical protein